MFHFQWYILKGRKIVKASMMKAAIWSERGRNRIVKKSYIGNIEVSTVFLCFDHGYGYLNDSPPVLFETMLFSAEVLPGDKYRYSFNYQTRCCTYAQALLQHKKAIDYVNKRYNYSYSSKLRKLPTISVGTTGLIVPGKNKSMISRLKKIAT